MRESALDLLSEKFAVARFDRDAEVPEWAFASEFVSVTRTEQELSVVCHEAALPSAAEAAVEIRRGFRCLRVRGPLDFSETGVLAALAHPLADAGVSIFVLSTYDTDYLLVAAGELERAIRALTTAGHTVHL